MNKRVFLLVAALLLASALSSGAARDLDEELRRVPTGPVDPSPPTPPKGKTPIPSFLPDGAFGTPDGGFGIPGVPGWGGNGNGFQGFPGSGGGGGSGWGNMGGGWGAGYGSPSGGYSRGGIVRPSVVCREKGPCYKKKLTCPAKCFTSYSRSGKNYGGGGGGGGCTIDCTKKCVAYC